MGGGEIRPFFGRTKNPPKKKKNLSTKEERKAGAISSSFSYLLILLSWGNKKGKSTPLLNLFVVVLD